MTIRKRNDDNGHVRGQGTYSASKPTLDRRDHFLRPVTEYGVPSRVGAASPKSAEGTIMGVGDRKAGLSAKLDKK